MQQIETTSRNGKSSLDLLKDHLELVSLEWEFEKREGWRRLISLGVGAILIFSSFVYMQMALFGWFLQMGLRGQEISVIFGCIYFVSGIIVIWFFGRRQNGLGPPFQGSLSEFKRSFNWIEKRFF